ncbi:MAG TPA: DNA-binding protein [Alphaproteobacteria bacterium]|nr:DNA-binding protein [Alphaproteobacteria bacterium]
MPLFEIAIVLALIVFNGSLAMSELAVVSARRARLKALADDGSLGAQAAMKLAEDPGRFLSTVQIGITAVGIIAGAFSGSALGARLSGVLMELGLSEPVAEPVGFGVVIAAITFISLVVGELVPKQLALRNAEAIAVVVAIPMTVLARIAAPFVMALDVCSSAILRLLGREEGNDSAITQEEIKTLVAEAEHAGVLEPEERRMISGVLRLGHRPVRAVMTPRMDVDVLDLSMGPDKALAFIADSGHTRLPVSESKDGEVIGIVYAKDLLNAYIRGGAVDPREFVRQAPTIPDTMDALEAVTVLRESPVHLGLVHDEYGHFQGIVTTTDILSSIVGDFKTDQGDEEPDSVQRDDGSWLLSGSMRIDAAVEVLGIKLDPGRDYSTVAGLVLNSMQRLPSIGESFEVSGWRFEVVDLDGRRVDKVLVSRLTAAHRRAHA